MVRRWRALVGLAALAGCGAPSATPPAEAPEPSPILDNPDEARAFEQVVGRLSCDALYARVPSLAGELRALEPRAIVGELQRAIVTRALACDQDWAALLVFRYLPRVIVAQHGVRTARATYEVLRRPEQRERALAALLRLVASSGHEAGDTVSDEAWWQPDSSAFRPELVLALTCEELTGMRPATLAGYRFAKELAGHASCSSVVDTVLRAGLTLSSEARADACADLQIAALRWDEAQRRAFAEDVGVAAATDPGKGEYASRSASVRGFIVPIPFTATRVHTEYPGRVQCEPLAIAWRAFATAQHSRDRISFRYYGAPRAFVLVGLTGDGALRPDAAFATALASADAPDELRAAVARASRLELTEGAWLRDHPEWGAATDARGALPEMAPAGRSFSAKATAKQLGDRARLYAIDRDGHVVTTDVRLAP